MNREEIPAWTAFLKRTLLFRDLTPEHLQQVATRLKALSLPKGATLYSRGDPGDALYLITSGQVRLLSERAGREVLIAFLGRGDALGEMSLLTGEPRSVTVKLETTCEFLMLSKKDFEEVARENPLIIMLLSRIIAQRMARTNQAPDPSKAQRQQILVLADALGEGGALLLCHTALGMVEQTRRRVLLVDMGPDCGMLAKTIGFKPILTSEAMLREMDLRDPEIIDRMVSEHPSGLRVMSLPTAVFGGRLYRGIFLFMNLLRDIHDFVLIRIGSSLGDVERSVLEEAEQWVLLGAKGREAAWNELETGIRPVPAEGKKITRVWVGDGGKPDLLGLSRDATFLVPWKDEISAEFARGEGMFQIMDRHPRTARSIQRLVRHLSGLTVGLAMGSGAALGYSLIGVLKGLQRANIDVDVIAGTSMGALIAGFFAMGTPVADIEAVARRIDKAWVYENLFWDLTVPRSSIFAGVTLLRFFKSYFGDLEFHQLELPFACVATDIETGEPVILKEGRVAEAIRASCGIPLIFAPFHHQGRFLVDGGLVDPVPSRVVSQLGADIVISINLTLPAAKRKSAVRERHGDRQMALTHLAALNPLKNLGLPEILRAPNMFEILFQMIYTMEYEIAQTRLDPVHVVIQPEVSNFSWTEMHRAKEIIAAGERAADEAAAKIKSLLPYFADYCKVPLRPAKWNEY